jgi:uncharacterized protein (DUF1684 family)
MRDSRARAAVLAALSAVMLASFPETGRTEDGSYAREIESWRREREANLKKDDGWLTVAGLYWLREGENWIGADNANDFVLPEGSAPPVVGVFDLHEGRTSFRAQPGVAVTQHGKPVETAALERGEKEAIGIGRLSMWVHGSGERLAIRLRDLDSEIRKEFTGLAWFPVDPAFRITARFSAYPKPREVEILNMLGDIERYQSPGTVELEVGGETVRMEPVIDSDDGSLWFIFRDGTSGKESYPAARFLHTDLPKAGQVVLDFNKAYNPPCAFNPHTTCPMPSKENRLRVPIRAGEMDYHKKGTHRPNDRGGEQE